MNRMKYFQANKYDILNPWWTDPASRLAEEGLLPQVESPDTEIDLIVELVAWRNHPKCKTKPWKVTWTTTRRPGVSNGAGPGKAVGEEANTLEENHRAAARVILQLYGNDWRERVKLIM